MDPSCVTVARKKNTEKVSTRNYERLRLLMACGYVCSCAVSHNNSGSVFTASPVGLAGTFFSQLELRRGKFNLEGVIRKDAMEFRLPNGFLWRILWYPKTRLDWFFAVFVEITKVMLQYCFAFEKSPITVSVVRDMQRGHLSWAGHMNETLNFSEHSVGKCLRLVRSHFFKLRRIP